jgi:hypothetical protein
VVVASDYPFLDVFWTMIIFVLWIVWFLILFRVIADLVRRHDISGWVKVLWMLVVILLPFLGVFIYVITQGHRMAERDMRQAEAAQSEFDSYVKSVASTGGPTAEIERAHGLRASGAITQAEFDAIKAKALAQS